MKTSAVLHNAEQAQDALRWLYRECKPWLLSGHKLFVEVDDEEPKTREQEEKYHAMIGDIANQVSLIPGRHRESAADAKRLLVSAFREDTKDMPELRESWAKFGHWTLAPGLRGELVPLGIPTRRFGKRLASAFIEWLYAFGSEHGVQWTDPVEEVA